MDTHLQTETAQTPNKQRTTKDYKYNPAMWPLILIVVGLYLLLRNFGILNERVLGAVREAWPLLLVWFGIHLATRNNPRLRMLGAIVTISILVFIVLQTTGAQIPNFR